MQVSQPSLSLLRQHLNVFVTKWHTLIKVAGDPYRPELYYMRGPGPKWHAKHRRQTGVL